MPLIQIEDTRQGARRPSVTCHVGRVPVGGSHPVVVQSMTNTDTADVQSSVNQVMSLANAGSELVRITVNTEEAAQAVPKIVETVRMFGVKVPIVGDFHYNGHILLKKYPDMARALAKYRINPGNVNIGKKHDDNFRTMIEVAVEHNKPVRIGVNWGSLDGALLTRMMDENSKLADPLDAKSVMMNAMVVSALESAAAAERHQEREDVVGAETRLHAGIERYACACGGALVAHEHQLRDVGVVERFEELVEVLRHADTLGLAHVVTRLRALHAEKGARFEPCALLVAKAEAVETFTGAVVR